MEVFIGIVLNLLITLDCMDIVSILFLLIYIFRHLLTSSITSHLFYHFQGTRLLLWLRVFSCVLLLLMILQRRYREIWGISAESEQIGFSEGKNKLLKTSNLSKLKYEEIENLVRKLENKLKTKIHDTVYGRILKAFQNLMFKFLKIFQKFKIKKCFQRPASEECWKKKKKVVQYSS